MCRRFLADEEDFSEDKIAQAMVQDRFKNNGKIDDCINEITRYIIQKIG